jgi:hypothetical protein
MAERFVLCRRDVGPIGELRYCGKSIGKRNRLNWCEECRARLPYWPVEKPLDSSGPTSTIEPPSFPRRFGGSEERFGGVSAGVTEA